MIKIENGEFFGVNLEIANDYVLLNFMIQPEEFDLNCYQKTPFCTIVIHDSNKNFGFTKILKKDIYKKELIKNISNISSTYETRPLNLYMDATEYDSVKSKFECKVFHTIIYYIDMDTPATNTDFTLVGSYPLKGILTQIKKNSGFSLYNGKFIACKMFKDKTGMFSTGLVYILADVKSYFKLEEYVYDEGDEYGYLNTRNWIFRINANGQLDLKLFEYSSAVPYAGREYLFTKTGKNLFQLSDIPSNIQVRMKTDTFDRKL